METRIPSKEECLKILRKHQAPFDVIYHCLMVTEITERISSQIREINRELVIAGAMLHDIGRSKDHTIFHAIEGARIIEREKLDQRLVSIVRKHIGSGITENEAEKLGLPLDDYIPRTIEEIVVSYSDNLTSDERECSFEETLEDFCRKFGEDSHVVKGYIRQKEIIEGIISKNNLKEEIEKKTK
ncbi:MAG: HDIG domain-containing protein [Candidatus Heimdallarchaeota archaeon]|nr:HDIG domain-containing protein [Candidatus Heimdallarchaeota archaeon]